MSTRLLLRSLALAVALAPLGGCSPTIKKPRLLHPGPAPVQRYNATQFDPYPLPDMGPEIVGGRPIDYMVPVPEVERANQFREQQAARGTMVIVPQPSAGVPMLPSPPAYMPTFPPPGSGPPPVEYRY
jgi:hypothetical protein